MRSVSPVGAGRASSPHISLRDVGTGSPLLAAASPSEWSCELLNSERGRTVVVDASNPLAGDFMSLALGHTTSAGEQVASRLPGAFVGKAFNTIMAATLHSPVLGGVRQLLPVAGDDPTAKKEVITLGDQLGFKAVDAGPISNSRYLEPAVELLIQLAYTRGLGANIGFHLARN